MDGWTGIHPLHLCLSVIFLSVIFHLLYIAMFPLPCFAFHPRYSLFFNLPPFYPKLLMFLFHPHILLHAVIWIYSHKQRYFLMYYCSLSPFCSSLFLYLHHHCCLTLSFIYVHVCRFTHLLFKMYAHIYVPSLISYLVPALLCVPPQSLWGGFDR